MSEDSINIKSYELLSSELWSKLSVKELPISHQGSLSRTNTSNQTNNRISLNSQLNISEGKIKSNVGIKSELDKKISTIHVGDTLKYGTKLYFEECDNVVRLKDIGVNKRILLLGVIGSFTPDCWNRHLFLVLKHFEYFKERGVHHICCISTNDPYVHKEWGRILGVNDKILMFSDVTAKFTQQIGMDIIVPWLDSQVRSKRYVLLADDMIVKKLIVAPDEGYDTKWDCDHINNPKNDE